MRVFIQILFLLCCLGLVSCFTWPQKVKYSSDEKPAEKIAATLYGKLNALEEHVEQFVDFTQTLNSRPNDTATYGINQFTDLSAEEFKTRLSQIPPPSYSTNRVYNGYYPNDLQLPGSFDWREKNVISSVKNQALMRCGPYYLTAGRIAVNNLSSKTYRVSTSLTGRCGSCWAFATIAVLEARAAIQHKGMNDYSEQQLVDCIEGGCNGGRLPSAFGYLKDFGAMSEADYPYRGVQAYKCQSHPIKMKFAEILSLPRDETAMANSLVDGGPFAIGVLVSEAFRSYRSGVFNNDDCDAKPLGWHAMAVVGFGDGHWIVKNSWGTDFGEGGFVRVARGKNWCHIAEHTMTGWV